MTEKKSTTYVVLEEKALQAENGDPVVAWVQIGDFDASSPRGAMSKAAENRQTPIKLVATPKRSFVPTPVTFKTVASFSGSETYQEPVVERPLAGASA